VERIINKLRNKVIRGRRKGCRCPVCDKYVKTYKRQITAAMVKTLWHMKLWFEETDGHHNDKWMPVEDYIAKLPLARRPLPRGASSNFSLMQHWNLITPKPGNRDDGSKRNGYWRITKKGVRFLNNKIHVEKYAVEYNGELIELSDEMVDIKYCLRQKFNYEELMKL